jgi:hypothetical protein
MSELIHRIKVFVFQQAGPEPHYLLLRSAQGIEGWGGPVHGTLGFGEKLETAIEREVLDDTGILQPADMPAALAALEAAITQEEAERRAAEAEAAARGEELPEMDAVSLRQRATPFIEMLRRCQQADKDIVWGV